jgi:rhodanese-related sulfurtransferase
LPKSIDREAVRLMLEDGAQLVEVLPAEEYGIAHIKGALNIPLRELAGRAGELDRSRPIIVYCNDLQ